MSEMIKYVAIYGGPAGIAFALLVYLFRDILIQKLLSKLTPDHSYKVIMRLMLFGFFICLLIVMGFYYIQLNKNPHLGTQIGFKCEQIKETVNIIKRISSTRNQISTIDNDDLIILNAIEEKFLQYQQINPECDVNLSAGIQKEIEKTESILKKYEH